jgi:hypothetical protein
VPAALAPDRPDTGMEHNRATGKLASKGEGSCPRTGIAWTSTGTPYEPRGLKYRADGTIRVVPIPPVLARMLRRHLRQFGTAADGRLFPGTRSTFVVISSVSPWPALTRGC